MDTNKAEAQVKLDADFAQYEAERIRIMNKLGKQLEGEVLPFGFAAVVSLADAVIDLHVQNVEAKKFFAKLLLSQAVTSAFTVGLTDEELQEAILMGEKDAKPSISAGADFMASITSSGEGDDCQAQINSVTTRVNTVLAGEENEVARIAIENVMRTLTQQSGEAAVASFGFLAAAAINANDAGNTPEEIVAEVRSVMDDFGEEAHVAH